MHSDFEEFAEEPKPKKIGKVRFVIGLIVAVIRITVVSLYAFVLNSIHFTGMDRGTIEYEEKISLLSTLKGMIGCIILGDWFDENLFGLGVASIFAVINHYTIFGKDKPKFIIIFTIAEALLLMVIIILARRCFGGPCDLECFQERIKP